MIKVDTERRAAIVRSSSGGDEREHSYDYLVAASGLRRVYPVVPQSLTRELYIQETGNHVRKVRDAPGREGS